MTVIWIAAYLLAGFLGYGLMLGALTHEFPSRQNFVPAFLLALMGPLGIGGGLMGSALTGSFHFRLRPLSTEERWIEFQKDYAILGRSYFDRHYN